MKNEITGDTLMTKPQSDLYRDNWDKIFGKSKDDSSAYRIQCAAGCGNWIPVLEENIGWDHVCSECTGVATDD